MNDARGVSPGRDLLDQAALRESLLRRRGWRRLDVVSATGSTNADLVLRAAVGEDISWSVLIAEHQTTGRGRNGRAWIAEPSAGISMSVGLPTIDLPPSSWGWVPLAAGLAVVDAVESTHGITTGLKWPNDVLSVGDGRKLAGILAEVTASDIVVGIGVNVHAVENVPGATATTLTSLGAIEPDRSVLIVRILEQLQRRMAALTGSAGAAPSIMADYLARSVTISSRVRATLPGDREVMGEACSIDGFGRLQIDTGDDVVSVAAGDVVHLRPV